MRLDIFEKRAKATAEAAGFNANEVTISVDPSAKMVAVVLSGSNQFSVRATVPSLPATSRPSLVASPRLNSKLLRKPRTNY